MELKYYIRACLSDNLRHLFFVVPSELRNHTPYTLLSNQLCAIVSPPSLIQHNSQEKSGRDDWDIRQSVIHRTSGRLYGRLNRKECHPQGRAGLRAQYVRQKWLHYGICAWMWYDQWPHRSGRTDSFCGISDLLQAQMLSQVSHE